MAYTNAQMLRLEIGDSGIAVRDVADGDDTAKVFYLSAPPVLALSDSVTVGGVSKTRTTDYTIDNFAGAVTFLAAPAAGSANVVVVYTAVQVADEDVTEALRQYGLTAASTADIGRITAMLQAALLICDSQAARWAGVGDVTTDGTSIGQGGNSAKWLAKAAALRATLASASGITSVPIVRIDGYNVDEVTTQDVQTTATNPRRRFYGEPDAIP
ncbi:MAG: hypothetical protein V2A79_03765 [Planctomycetota bacterium]